MDNRLGARAAETARVRVNGRTVPRGRARLEAHSRNRWFQVLLRRELARTVAGNSSVKLLDLVPGCDASASAIVAQLVPAAEKRSSRNDGDLLRMKSYQGI